jgi:nicotinate-nucleotide pyrophosphorylase (carboxylating)
MKSELKLSTESLALIDLALIEDLGSNGDITSDGIIPAEAVGIGRLIAKSPLTVCGHPVGMALVEKLRGSLKYKICIDDGSIAKSGDVLGELSGTVRELLLVERTLLNFFQRLSGVATTTAKAVEIAGRTGVKILDTRKTTPGMRQLEKYAVMVGGGVNHRSGLFDMVLIKNNHVDAVAGDIALAVRRSREFLVSRGLQTTKIEVEVRNLEELKDALRETPDRIMFDNFTPDQVRDGLRVARDWCSNSVEIEVSGGINLGNLADFALQGVDFVSVGFITHSVGSVDISFKIES